jgi:histidinol-phosphate phosphatase family protein
VNIILLAGGRGSRSENPQLPKILQEIAPGVTLLDHWIQLLGKQEFRKIELILGHEHQQISKHLRQMDIPSEMEVSHQIDNRLSGTSNAVLYSKFYGEQSLVLMGDTLSFLDYKKVLSGYAPNAAKAAFLAHKNSHLFDSDSVELSKNGECLQFFRKRESNGFDNLLALTGGVLLGSEAWKALSELSARGDIVHDLFSVIPIAEIHIAPFVGLSMDCGTPGRLQKARNLFSFWSTRPRFPVVVLDRDGTLIPDLPQGRLPESSLFIDSRDALAIASINETGVPVFMTTNQPALAKGWITFSDIESVHRSMGLELAKYGAWLDDILFCPHHPEAGHSGEVPEFKIECQCRKPAPGMLDRLISKYQLQNCEIWVLGDSDVDREFAWNTSANFIRVEHGGERSLAMGLERIMRDWNCE